MVIRSHLCGKHIYFTRLDALIVAARRLSRKNVDTDYLRPYRCRICGFWHLTKQKKKPK
jgi:hypothetical protein